MRSFHVILSSLSIGLMGSTALADVSPQDVWDQWQEMFTLYGEDAIDIGAVDEKGGTLTVTDMTINFDQDDVKMTAAMPRITFQDLGNGSVAVTMAEDFPISMVSSPNFGPKTTMNMVMSQKGLSMIASGDPDAMNYAVLAQSMSGRFDAVTEDDVEIPMDVSFSLNNMNGNYVINKSDIQNITYALNADSLTYNLDVTDPETNGSVAVKGSISNLKTDAQMTMPLEPIGDFSNFMSMGMTSNATYTYTAGQYEFSASGDGSTVNGSGGSAGGTLTAEITDTSFGYSTQSNDATLTVQSSDFPFPVDIEIGQSGFGLTMPAIKTDAPEAFSLNLNLTDVSVSDGIWNLFDPGEILPRSPATIAMDITGAGRWLIDVFDSEKATEIALSGETPGEIKSINLNDLTLAIAGAEVNGTGDFIFDNTDTTSFDGLPRPEGAIDIEASGVNGLIDNLITMGIIPEQQAMGFRMMLGVFATTSPDEDKLSSKLEINEDGHVIANGQRIR